MSEPGGRPSRRLWARWTLAVTAGEVTGFLVPAAVGAATADASQFVQLVSLVAAGAVEGTLLGVSQGWVLRGMLPELPLGRWVRLTALAAACAWLLAMIPASLGGTVPTAALIALMVPAGIAVLLSIGYVQWRVLRDLLPHAGRWIPGTAAGWLAGLAVFTGITTPFWQPGQDFMTIALIGMLGASAMAVTMAAVTGAVMVRLVMGAAGGGLRQPVTSPGPGQSPPPPPHPEEPESEPDPASKKPS
ncbi:hypothetical protein ABGB12_14340 [Actinocorallia sp. B10E7]|uniref:hypothetical protein n=1 Tax=Actinocorallia sp. B10E7 TaxID=3153558 RepID=UPI00325D85EC